jgi:hypothetical protein
MNSYDNLKLQLHTVGIQAGTERVNGFYKSYSGMDFE